MPESWLNAATAKASRMGRMFARAKKGAAGACAAARMPSGLRIARQRGDSTRNGHSAKNTNAGTASAPQKGALNTADYRLGVIAGGADAGTAVSGYAIHMYGRHHGAPIRLILRLKGILRRLIPRLQGLLLQFKRLLRRLLGRPALFPFSFRILVNLKLFLQILEHVSHETGAKALVLLIISHCRI